MPFFSLPMIFIIQRRSVTSNWQLSAFLDIVEGRGETPITIGKPMHRLRLFLSYLKPTHASPAHSQAHRQNPGPGRTGGGGKFAGVPGPRPRGAQKWKGTPPN